MKSFTKKLLAACVVAGLPVLALATSVRVQVTGVVDYNVIGGSVAGVQPGDPAVMSFNLDSTDFVDSPNYPTRGYVIDLPSFAMTVGGRPVTMDIPQPVGSAYACFATTTQRSTASLFRWTASRTISPWRCTSRD
jgi:hypothetical protein